MHVAIFNASSLWSEGIHFSTFIHTQSVLNMLNRVRMFIFQYQVLPTGKDTTRPWMNANMSSIRSENKKLNTVRQSFRICHYTA